MLGFESQRSEALTLGKSLNCTEPQFLHLKNEECRTGDVVRVT